MDTQGYTPDWPDNFKERYRREGYWTDETFASLIDVAAERFAQRTAIIDGEQRVSFRQLQEQSLCAASGLVRIGLQAGDRVVVQMPNCYEFIVISAALFRVGVVPVYALPGHRQRDLEHLITLTEAKAYIGVARYKGQDNQKMLNDLRGACPSLEQCIFKNAFDEAIGLQMLFIAPQDSYPIVRADDVALMQISGGTTGLPKLITRCHREYLYSIRRSCECCEFDAQTVYLAVLPLAHNFTMSSPGFWGVLREGGTVVVTPSPLPSDAFELIDKHQINCVALVPPLVRLWVDALEPGDRRLASLRLVQVGGAKLPPSVAKMLCERIPGHLQQVFGMAEGLVCYSALGEQPDQAAEAWVRPMSEEDEILIVDDDGLPVAVGETGHLLTRGPYTIRGYFNAAEQNESSFDGQGFYRTGDLVRQSQDGRLQVMGRDKEQINKGAEKVSPEEVEEALIATGLVSDAVVVAQEDEYLGERIIGVVILHPNSDLTLLKRTLLQRMASYKVPDAFVTVEHFPTTAVGKLSRRQLRLQVRQLIEQGAPC